MVPAAAANVICICSFLVIFSTVWLGCFGCWVYKPFQRVTPRLLDRYKVKTTSSEFKSSLPFPAISHRSALARFGFHTSHCVGQWPPPHPRGRLDQHLSKAMLFFKCQNLSKPPISWGTKAGKWNRLMRRTPTLKKPTFYQHKKRWSQRSNSSLPNAHQISQETGRIPPSSQKGLLATPKYKADQWSLILQTHMHAINFRCTGCCSNLSEVTHALN